MTSIESIFNASRTGREVIAVFRDGRKINYTITILYLLKTDPEILYVYDAETGEIL